MKCALVGCTGFVGSNIAARKTFDGLFHSKNIEESFGTAYDLLVYAGVRAEKFLANQNPAADWRAIEQAMANLTKIKAGRLVLISTVDVYPNPCQVDETTLIDEGKLQPYGLHRWKLEQWVRERFPAALIVRLPGLYGPGLKKNFLFDMIHMVPSMIKKEKMDSLAGDMPKKVAAQYELKDNGFFQLKNLSVAEKKKLREFFLKYRFNALAFTDSRSTYQFYPLPYLWQHIETALQEDVRLLCLASEPVSAGEIYQAVLGTAFDNPVTSSPAAYDMRSRHSEILGGSGGYTFTKEWVLQDICQFIRNEEIIYA